MIYIENCFTHKTNSMTVRYSVNIKGLDIEPDIA